jgi:hypothetical protein
MVTNDSGVAGWGQAPRLWISARQEFPGSGFLPRSIYVLSYMIIYLYDDAELPGR